MKWDESKHPRDEIGRFTEGYFDVEMLEKQPRGHLSTIFPGRGVPPTPELISGATSGAVDPDSDRGREHAERYYEEMRHRKDDIPAIAKNSGFTEEDIRAIKNYIFFEVHDLPEGRGRFTPDCDMAQSWQRLTDGKHVEADMIFLKHELMELLLVKRGYSQSEAHDLTNQKYNYNAAIIKMRMERINGKTKKH